MSWDCDMVEIPSWQAVRSWPSSVLFALERVNEKGFDCSVYWARPEDAKDSSAAVEMVDFMVAIKRRGRSLLAFVVDVDVGVAIAEVVKNGGCPSSFYVLLLASSSPPSCVQI